MSNAIKIILAIGFIGIGASLTLIFKTANKPVERPILDGVSLVVYESPTDAGTVVALNGTVDGEELKEISSLTHAACRECSREDLMRRIAYAYGRRHKLFKVELRSDGTSYTWQLKVDEE